MGIVQRHLSGSVATSSFPPSPPIHQHVDSKNNKAHALLRSHTRYREFLEEVFEGPLWVVGVLQKVTWKLI